MKTTTTTKCKRCKGTGAIGIPNVGPLTCPLCGGGGQLAKPVATPVAADLALTREGRNTAGDHADYRLYRDGVLLGRIYRSRRGWFIGDFGSTDWHLSQEAAEAALAGKAVQS
jgi:hypothetical protein